MDDKQLYWMFVSFMIGVILGLVIGLASMDEDVESACSYLATELNISTIVANGDCYVESESGNLIPLMEWIE